MEQRSEKTQAIVRRNRVAVSAIVATYNEERYIGRCLDALLAQRTDFGDLEILVIDGCSTDATRAIVRGYPEYGTKIRLIENPRKQQVYAWNMGLREMRGQYYAMMTAHAEYAPDYFLKCLETLQRTGAAAVGGVPRAYGEGALGRAIAFCMSTPFGVGNARFRYLQSEEECDTVPLIFAAKETVAAVGGWDERIVFDEDSDMSYRLRARGGKLVVSPHIGVRYYMRRSIKALWKQALPLRLLAPVHAGEARIPGSYTRACARFTAYRASGIGRDRSNGTTAVKYRHSPDVRRFCALCHARRSTQNWKQCLACPCDLRYHACRLRHRLLRGPG